MGYFGFFFAAIILGIIGFNMNGSMMIMWVAWGVVMAYFIHKGKVQKEKESRLAFIEKDIVAQKRKHISLETRIELAEKTLNDSILTSKKYSKELKMMDFENLKKELSECEKKIDMYEREKPELIAFTSVKRIDGVTKKEGLIVIALFTIFCLSVAAPNVYKYYKTEKEKEERFESLTLEQKRELVRECIRD